MIRQKNASFAALSGYVEEVRPLIPKQGNLRLTLPFDPMVSLVIPSFLVLGLQAKVCDDATNRKEEDHVGEDDSVPSPIIWLDRVSAQTSRNKRRQRTATYLVLRSVDVARDNSVQIANADRHADSNTPLVDSFDVVCSPGDSIRYAGINAESSKKSASIFDVWICGAEQHTEADNSQEGYADVAPSALLGAIGQPTDEDGQDSSGSVGRHTEKIGRRRGKTELADNGWQEQGESVQWAVTTHVADGEGPGLPILDRIPKVSHLERLVLG